ncbi:MAG: tripartite tricarboxylate transporter substrate binding protein [Burkholderiales bacterium]|nr:tripartite tricarboxylate transporter substrate binding protein [Burkholderiales bacterium]
MRTALRALAVAACAMMATAAPAQSLKILLPANPGGGWDQTGRTLGKVITEAKLASSVQYENKGGAGGTIGLAQFVNVSKGDPNALMIGGQAMVAAVELNKSAVRVQQATPLARLVAEYSVIVVPANSPYKTMGDLIKAFKENPGKVSFGAGSAGSTEHLLLGLVAKAVGVDSAKLNYIAFKGGGEAVPAIIGGHVAAGASGLGEFGEHIRSGKMRALAVSSPAAMEGIPSLKEQGIDVVFGNWRGIWGAPGITPQQRDQLIQKVKGATETAEWKAMLAKMGWSNVYLSGPEFEKFVNDESQTLGALVTSLGLRK